MSGERKFAKAGMVLGGTQVAGQLCSLGRNAIIARLVSPADFGISAIFLMVVAFLEMVSNLSLDRLLVQSADGDNDIFQRVAHFLQAMRGIVSFVILLALAGPVSSLFSIPETREAFYVLAFIPLLNGFVHLDPRRMERSMRFWPNASVELASQMIVLVAAWSAGKWFGNYWAMLFLLLLKTLIMVLGSHFVAERRYSWSKERQYTKRFMSFGWPLLVNGLLLFGILQGDRFLLGSAKKLFGSGYDMSDIGLYSAAFMLAMIPAMLCIRVCSPLFLPVLSREQHSPLVFNAKSRLFSQGLAIVAVFFSTVMLLSGEQLLPIVFGDQYKSTSMLVGLLSVMWAVRIIRALPATISMAKGNTKLLMYTNLVRLFFFAGVAMVVLREMDLIWVAIVGLIGEVCVYYCSLYWNSRQLAVPLSIFLPSDIFLAAGLVVVTVLNITVFSTRTGTPWFLGVLITSLALPAIAVICFPEVQQKLRSFRRDGVIRQGAGI